MREKWNIAPTGEALLCRYEDAEDLLYCSLLVPPLSDAKMRCA